MTATKKLLSCPLCDSEWLGFNGRANPHFVTYRCKEARCDFRFSVHREALAKAGIEVPPPAKDRLGSFERAKSSAGTRITVSGRST